MKKRSSIKPVPKCLLFLLMSILLLPGHPLLAQAPGDSLQQKAGWQQRSFSPEKLQQLQKDEDLEYPVAVAEDGWGSKLMEWFSRWLSEVLGETSDTGLLKVLMYLFFVGAGLFLITCFLDIDITSLVRRKAAAVPISSIGEGITENIHALDFEQEIKQAVAQQDYRKAVRLVYLASLKRLSDAGLVRWEPGKTNRQYQLELKDPAFKNQFSSLGYFFEYAWYGDFPVNEPLYQKVAAEYRQFCKQVEAAA